MPTKQKNKRIIIAMIISIISVYALIACEKPDDSIRNEKPVEAENILRSNILRKRAVI